MNYEQTLDFIHSRTRYGSRLGLFRMERVLELMGNPHKELKFIHIAGTNGKGSTTAMTAEILKTQGYKVGMYISPYVVDFRERMQINNQLIPKERLAETLTKIMPYLEILDQEETPITEFELDTVLAIQYFYDEKCDFVVFEVGLGGRFDATNIIDAPVVASIGKIAYDHVDILGDTIKKIAFEKCGIIKKGCRVVSYPLQENDAKWMIEDTCKMLHIKGNFGDLTQLENVSWNDNGAKYTYKGEDYEIGLVGEHQIYNSITVLSIIEEMRAAGVEISQESVVKGLKNARFGGRLEEVCKNPSCIIDGAHNPDGVEVLCKTIDKVYKPKKIITVMGMLGDKDFKNCVKEVAGRSDVYVITVPDNPRAATPEAIYEIAKDHCKEIYIKEVPYEAAKFAKSIAGKDDIVIACGSLYMIGEAKKAFEEN
ncbi:MAG: bifunctional folylpolyglutamate synthase/dihydrofolate synthase [Ruminococcaceae bacterium]|nr:bifunctional folylpolyglutamate synthase/dihydrofolate synthase [Oscillospiraceae bacterium]